MVKKTKNAKSSLLKDLFNVPNSVTLFRIVFFLPLGVHFLIADNV